MDSLPEEIVNEILLIVDKPTLYCASQVCKQWRRLSMKQTKVLKTIKDFHVVCRDGDRLSIIKSKFDLVWIRNSLYPTCTGGHKDLTKLMIDKGANNWNLGLYGACYGGHKELVELMITKGADNFDTGLHSACSGGHKELIDLMISRGASSCHCDKSLSQH